MESVKMLDLAKPLITAVKNGGAAVKEKIVTKKTFKYILLDSVIVAGIAAFSVMGLEIPSAEELFTVGKAFGATLLFELGVERGLKRNVK